MCCTAGLTDCLTSVVCCLIGRGAGNKCGDAAENVDTALTCFRYHWQIKTNDFARQHPHSCISFTFWLAKVLKHKDFRKGRRHSPCAMLHTDQRRLMLGECCLALRWEVQCHLYLFPFQMCYPWSVLLSQLMRVDSSGTCISFLMASLVLVVITYPVSVMPLAAVVWELAFLAK